jgi:hypothetical protein
MKTFFLVAIALIALFALMISPIITKHLVAFTKDVVQIFKQPGISPNSHRFQGGYVTLLRSYGGYQAGQVVELPASTEATLIASGGGTTSAGPATAGPLSCTQTQGAATVATGASSVVITNPLVTPQSVIFAVVAQAAADATMLRVERIVAAAGSFTIYGTANATANTAVDWAIIGATGVSSNPG